MATQEPTAAPAPFLRLLRQAIANQQMSLREIGKQVDVSTAYMSRLVNEQRGLPADGTIRRLEEVLEIERGLLFHAAGRHDAVSGQVMKRENARILMRTLNKLTDEEIAKVQRVAQGLVNKRQSEGK